MEARERFRKVYSSLPIGARREIILVLEKVGPINWEVAYNEIDNETELGEIILKKLEALGFI